MRRLTTLLIVWLTLIAGALEAATITGTIRNPSGLLFTGTVMFEASNPVKIIGPSAVTGNRTSVKVSNGALRVSLLAGSYSVLIPDTARFTIVVPDSSLSYDIITLITEHAENLPAARVGIPGGGNAGQVLTKSSGTSWDVEWVDQTAVATNGLPSGGTAGQLLSKTSTNDFDADWITFDTDSGLPSGGTVGQILYKSSTNDFDATWSSTETLGLLTTFEQNLTDEQQIVVQRNIGSAAFYDIAGYPQISSLRESVTVCNVADTWGAPYVPAAGTGLGMAAPEGGNLSVGWVSMGNQFRIQWDCTVTAVRFYVPATLPADCEIHFDFWRKSEDRWDYVGTTGNLRASVTANGTVQTVVLSSVVRGLRQGDYVGGHLVYTDGSWGAGVHMVATPSVYAEWTSQDTQWAYSPTMADGAPWDDATTITGYTVPVQCFADSPVIALLGDSRISGLNYSRSLNVPTMFWVQEADPGWRLSRMAGLTVRNVAVEGNDTGEMEARMTNDVLAIKPRYLVFCPGGYNDMYAQPTRVQADYINSSSNIIEIALAAGIKVIVVSDFPFKDPFADPSDIQNVASDQWQVALKALCDTYDPDDVLYVDARPHMGTERPMTGDPNWVANNRWNLKSLFGADEDDMLHWSAAGGEQFSRVVTSASRDWLRAFDAPITEAQASLLYHATNANLALLQAYGPNTWQSTNAALTALSSNPNLYQATNAALTALSANPNLYHATNTVLTTLAGLGPNAWQATNVNLTSWGSMTTNAFITNLMTKWDDLQIPGLSLMVSASPPGLGAFGPSGGLQAFMFDKTSDEQAYTTGQLLHGYKEGTDIHPHIHFTPVDTASDGSTTNIVWGLEYSWANVGDAFAAPTIIYATNVVSATAWAHQIASFPAISGAGKTISSVLNMRPFRDADNTADKYDADAALLQLDIHYLRDSNGSTSELSK